MRRAAWRRGVGDGHRLVAGGVGLVAAWALVFVASAPAQVGDRASAPSAASPGQLQAGASPYTRVDGVSGSVTVIGSDLLTRVMTQLAQQFQRRYPETKVLVQGADSTAAAAALIQGTAQLATMSRMMEEGEVAKFEAKYGYRPTPYAIAVDALVVCVHKDNPLEGLTLDQADAIFSRTPRYSYKNITTWGQLSLAGDWADAPLNLYGLTAATGTHEFFRDHALNKEDFKPGVKEFSDSMSVVHGVAHDRYGMGYAGLAAATPEVRIVPLAFDEVSPFVEPTYENVKIRKYPLRRYLYLYVNQAPRRILPGDKPLPRPVREFLRFVHSREGQAEMVKGGYVAVEDWIIQHALAKIR